MDIDRKTLIHDLNNEISVLSCYLDIIEAKFKKGSSETEIQNSINKARSRMRQTCQNLEGLIDKERSFDLRFFLKSRIDDLICEYGIHINLHGETPFIVKSNESELCLFIKNIIKNSKEAGATHINVFFGRESVRFVDNGKGIEPSILDLLDNNMFFTTRGAGHGLGLLSMKRFSKRIKVNFYLKNSLHGGAAVILKKAKDYKKLACSL